MVREKEIAKGFGISLLLGSLAWAAVSILNPSSYLRTEILTPENVYGKRIESKLKSFENKEGTKKPDLAIDNAYILGQFIYGEAANQKEIVRKSAGKVMKNRVGRAGYKDTLEGVILSDSEFTCVGSEKNKNWKQATGQIKRNAYEDKVFYKCIEDAREILNGERLGYVDEQGNFVEYENQDDWIAYFDDSTAYKKLLRFNPRYWSQVTPDVKIETITLCIPASKGNRN